MRILCDSQVALQTARARARNPRLGPFASVVRQESPHVMRIAVSVLGCLVTIIGSPTPVQARREQETSSGIRRVRAATPRFRGYRRVRTTTVPTMGDTMSVASLVGAGSPQHRTWNPGRSSWGSFRARRPSVSIPEPEAPSLAAMPARSAGAGSTCASAPSAATWAAANPSAATTGPTTARAGTL